MAGLGEVIEVDFTAGLTTVNSVAQANIEAINGVTVTGLPPAGNLFLHYELDDGAGTTATDDGYGGNDGTLVNWVTPDWTTGPVDGALRFDGSNDWLRSPTFETFMQSSFSVSFWVKAVTLASSKQVFGIYDYQGSPGSYIYNGFYMHLQSDGEVNVVYKSNDNTATVSSDINTNDWTDGYHHVVITVEDGVAMKVYIDKVLVETFTGGADGDMTDVDMSEYSLGGLSDYFAWGCTRWYGSNVNYANVILDDIRMYDMVINEYHVEALYDLGTLTSNIVIHYESGTTDLDFDGSGTDKTETGAATDLQTAFRDSWTVAFAIKPDDGQPATEQAIFGNEATPFPANYFYISLQTTGRIQLKWVFDIGVTATFPTITALADGAHGSFTHVAWSHEYNGTLNVYIDGVAEGVSYPMTTTTYDEYQTGFTCAIDYWLGDINGTAFVPYAGELSYFTVYNEALSQAEIQALM